MIILYNKNSLSEFTRLSKKKVFNINNSKYIVRNGYKQKYFLDNYNKVINYYNKNVEISTKVKNLKKKVKLGISPKVNRFVIKLNPIFKNHNFFIITKNYSIRHSMIDIILFIKQSNNFLLLKPQIGGFKIISNGLIGIVPNIEIKKIFKGIKNSLLIKSFFNFFLKKKLSIIRLSTKLSKLHVVAQKKRRKKRYKLSNLIFFKIVSKSKYDSYKQNIKNRKKYNYRKRVRKLYSNRKKNKNKKIYKFKINKQKK